VFGSTQSPIICMSTVRFSIRRVMETPFARESRE
jgi:hypothetical protein